MTLKCAQGLTGRGVRRLSNEGLKIKISKVMNKELRTKKGKSWHNGEWEGGKE